MDGGNAAYRAVGRDGDGRGAGDVVVGRAAEVERISGLVDAIAGGGRLLVIAGAAGAGKSTLLDVAARAAGAAAYRVLRVSGRESERDLAFAGLHQLLRPVLSEAAALPDRQRRALLHALGSEPDAVPGATPETGYGAGPEAALGGRTASGGGPDLLLAGVAVLSLLSRLAGRSPVMVLVDDAQWLDAASADVLAFAARRLDDDPVGLLLAVRDGEPLPGFEPAYPTLALTPLGGEASGRLLDHHAPDLPRRVRDRILDQAAGNPLALLELAETAIADPGAVLRDEHGPLPVGERLAALYAARLAELPEAGRRALLLLAAADVADPPAAVLALLPAPDHTGPDHTGLDDKVRVAVEQSGLVRRTGRDLRFRHPLIRSAVYHAVPLDARLDAHRALAGALRGEPDRRAWHLAAATARPDAEVAAALERTAGRAMRRGGHAAAAKALARAAELHPEPGDSARLLVAAAGLAVLTGDLDWVEELAGQARARSDDPAVHAAAELHAGRLAALTGRHPAVFAGMARIAEDLAGTHPSIALDALTTAAVLRFYSGEESQRREIDRILPRVAVAPADEPLRDWVRMVSDPLGSRRELAARLPAMIAAAAGRPERLTALAIAAWLLDEIAPAVRAFDEAVRLWEGRGPLPDGLGGVTALAWLEYGRWEQARAVCAAIAALPATARSLHHARACAYAVDAMALAFQGDAAAARERADEALRLVDPLESRSVAVYARRALSAAAAVEGDYETAYEQVRAVFGHDGEPVHYHASYPALPELAAAAARTGRRAEAAGIVGRAARALARDGSPRLRALVRRSAALLAEPADAEPEFLAALAGPAPERRPFEHAQALLEYAEWLRRRRRIAEARPFLTAAHDTFRRLGARPWAERARAELRAAGLDVSAAEPAAFAELSPQQQQIVRLAARGLTNREIGERLFLSPRTVGSHLYRAFPKLGVTTRAQLRDLVAAAPPDEPFAGRYG
ncbi:DNA-binding CsgD family transcriptional regulator/energy-coupling factor transporter ATP-binding protein EcfA2 [Nonomuraea thailandensis]|uniref:DNA-binding CsgD family transcriptional regulator/energy-coupling factor transporter ATP-binding protein EcfA2 n=1 Tax=Nonomuraea thailandensis TaxID=1188745 RepID=A0A9X2GJN9_9ACTN|nr:LuxR family transcriptional regulator [Nonomuraea thailandensis]MCP2355773.1 DNA-binding CsgD family transcriptional regulator/energy-coupling factor transporter ATP-binding protein EcfA2 [Nonomuraea thailandensis]